MRLFNKPSYAMELRTLLLSLLTILAVSMVTNAQFPEFGIVVDAGSSGSRARVYNMTLGPGSQLQVPTIKEVFSYKVRPGISSFGGKTAELGNYITNLMKMVKESGAIPNNRVSETPIYFMATAGMRLLLESKANEVMEEINRLLSDRSINPFKYHPLNTRILSGEEEGAFAWITVNYLNGFFTGGRQDSVGVLELGGASTQIAFIPKGSPLANKFPVEVGGREFPLYVHSYLYYGQEYAMKWSREYLFSENKDKTVIENPCVLHDDSFNTTMDGIDIHYDGTGDPDECLKLVDEYVYKVEPFRCHPKPCAMGGVYQPTVDEMKEFYAIGAFFFPIRTFKVAKEDGRVLPQDILDGAFKYCRMDFREAKQVSKERNEYVSANCLMGLYTSRLLTKAYGFQNDTDKIRVINDIKDEPINWAMGALLYEISKTADALCEKVGAITGSASASVFTPHISIILICSLLIVLKTQCSRLHTYTFN